MPGIFLSIFGSHATCVKAAEIQTTRISVVVLLSCSATVVPGCLASENFSFAGKSEIKMSGKVNLKRLSCGA